ncbi:MAG: hypothetical protein H6500_01005 [Candidatus Woesearchaeota archaeon]|nr:hypothetical protein [Nanoarchaeota archaeon]USN44410.1 MAG: hypothetical protein H6500_01005 [Candidatus Woesearchaeota archaeon]
MFFFFLSAYILSYGGFLLGKATQEEHKEIKKKILTFSHIFRIFVYLATFFFLFPLTKWTLLFLFPLSLYVALWKKEEARHLHDIILLSSSLIFFSLFKSEYLVFTYFTVFALVFENSLRKFLVLREAYALALYTAAGLLLFAILTSFTPTGI